METGAERREFTRVPVRFETELRTDEGKLIRGRSRDVSLKGLIFECETPIPPGSRCRVSLILGEHPNQIRIDISGKIARSEDKGLAVEFLELGTESFGHLKNLVLYNSGEPEKVEREFVEHLGLKSRA